MTLRTISSNDLAAHTRDVVHQVRQGQPALVHSSGEDQIVLLDALDFRLLRGVAAWATRSGVAVDEVSEEDRTIGAYLDEEISLGRAAELLGLSRFDLQARFLRLDIPLRQGPTSEAEVQAEIQVAEQLAPQCS